MNICIIYFSRGYLQGNLWILYTFYEYLCQVPSPVRHGSQHSTQCIGTSNMTWIPQEKKMPALHSSTACCKNKYSALLYKKQLLCVLQKRLLKLSNNNVCLTFNCRRDEEMHFWMFGTFYSENNWGGKWGLLQCYVRTVRMPKDRLWCPSYLVDW